MSVGSGHGIRVAIEFLHVPSRVRIARTEPLPAGVDLLLRIAAGKAEAEGRPRAATPWSLREAAARLQVPDDASAIRQERASCSRFGAAAPVFHGPAPPRLGDRGHIELVYSVCRRQPRSSRIRV